MQTVNSGVQIMANDLNQCSFIGRLGKDVELRYLPSGEPVANFSIAVAWKSKDKEGAEWVSVVAFSGLAKICGDYLKKGSRVFISGKMKTRKWQAQDGTDRYSTEIVATDMQMLDSKPSSDGGHSAPQPQRNPQYAEGPEPLAADFSDDIPFAPVSSLIY